MGITQSDIDYYGRVACMPLALLINFSLFQYLLTMYYKRKREFYGFLLLFCGFGAFACLVPFAHEDDFVVNDLNDISETLSVTTFLVQIAMIGRDINKKMRIRSLRWLTRASEMLILFSIAVSVKDILELAFPDVVSNSVDSLDNILEEVSLWFIFGFRFFVVGMTKGFAESLKTKKIEVAMYLLFVTHEYPFQLLKASTSLNWEEVQALWHRVTMAMCLMHTIKTKLRSSSSKARGTTNHSKRPSLNHGTSGKGFTLTDGANKLTGLGPSMQAIKKSSRAVIPLGSSVRKPS